MSDGGGAWLAGLGKYGFTPVQGTPLTEPLPEGLALASAKQIYQRDKSALENGDLAKVPTTAPSKLKTEHTAVGNAKAQLIADPQTIEECESAGAKLGVLAGKVKVYLEATSALPAAQQKYESALARILAKVPAKPWEGAKEQHGAIDVKRRWITELVDKATTYKAYDNVRTKPQYLPELAKLVEAYLEAEAKLRAPLLEEFRSTPENQSELREQCFAKAFGCTLTHTIEGKQEPVPAKVLNKIAGLIEKLPAALLPAQWELKGVEGTKTGGDSDPVNGKAEFEYGVKDAPAFDQPYENAQPGEALEGTKNFEVTVTHEIGHAVDTRNDGAALTGTAAGGGWKKHGTFDNVVKELATLVSDFAGALQIALELPDNPLAEVTPAIAGLGKAKMKDADKLTKFLGSQLWELPGLNYPPEVTTYNEKIQHVADKVPMAHDLIKIILQGGQESAYFKLGNSPVGHGGRVYLDSGVADGWVSFERETWNTKVSMYQYRTPGEWFAEFWATANHSDSGVRNKAKDAYPAAHQWLADRGLLVVE